MQNMQASIILNIGLPSDSDESFMSIIPLTKVKTDRGTIFFNYTVGKVSNKTHKKTDSVLQPFSDLNIELSQLGNIKVELFKSINCNSSDDFFVIDGNCADLAQTIKAALLVAPHGSKNLVVLPNESDFTRYLEVFNLSDPDNKENLGFIEKEEMELKKPFLILPKHLFE